MSLKHKIVLIVGAAMLLLVCLGVTTLYPISRSFEALERDEARRNSARVLHAIQNRVEALHRTARDWSEWNDSYAFIQGHNESFVEDNLYLDALRTLRINFMAFYDRAGTVKWSGMFDLETGDPIEIAEFAPGALRADDVLLANTESGKGPRGIMATSLGPAVVASNPILPSDRPTAPARGTLVVGRLLDAQALDGIRKQVQVEFRIVATGSGPALPGFTLRQQADTMLVGHEPVPDIAGGAPRFVVHTLSPREITAVGRRAINLSIVLLGGTGVGALLIIWALLHWLVLRPVLQLSHQVVQIGTSGSPDARVSASGNDELGLLAREFNRTLARLQDTRQALADQAHRAGMSEMAAGVLHNLRNGLSPLVGRLERLAERLRHGAGDELGRAAAELVAPATPPGRRQRLADYIAAAGADVAATRAEAVDELTAMARMAHKLGQIITLQDRFIYAKDIAGAVPASTALDDAVGLLPAAAQRRVEIEIDPGIARLPPVAAPPLALMQVFHNLLVNADDAVRAAGRGPGQVRVAGRLVGDQVEITITDDGIGIAAGELTRIFERGFTTKPGDKGGLGLHWCANAVSAVGGRLWANSDGPGNGATFHVQLPLAQPGEAAA